MWNENAKRALDEQLGCDLTLFIWDGDTLAVEQKGRDGKGQTTHYVFEPGTFVPVAQGVMNHIEEMLDQSDYASEMSRDWLWQHTPSPKPLDRIAWYKCNHLGTPLEIMDEHGNKIWIGTYKAWGLAKEAITLCGPSINNQNPIRLQGQYFDPETALHYNRHRYYSPQTTKFISKDPIGFDGGINVYEYAPNPIEWIDPLGLTKSPNPCKAKNKDIDEKEKHRLERRCDELHDDFNRAMNSALKHSHITAHDTMPNPAKFIQQPYNGRRATNEHRGFRVEYDDRHKAHIDTFNRKIEKTICFEANQKTVGKIIRRFNR
ncbi:MULTISPECIES: RHS repeat-associated core domain-containing protein [Pseudomonas]|uniref:RHS repeat-associated core domain-containing protein n=1 Tax=Pseudomonas TaxID=286 RepID=UPI0015E8BD2A|nr:MULTISPECIES: RHS repeat-associated core domain-containing protein [Pseudomonas]UNT14708.1 RHS domain-containing protein [Pseudomonas sp. I3-I5]